MLIDFSEQFSAYCDAYGTKLERRQYAYIMHQKKVNSFIDKYKDNKELLCRVYSDLGYTKYDSELFPEFTPNDVEFFIALQYKIQMSLGAYVCNKYLCTTYVPQDKSVRLMTDEEFDRDIFIQMYEHYRYLLALDGTL